MSEQPLAYHAYQELADAYSEKVETKPHNAYLEKPAMLGLLPDVNSQRVLDVGCGPGVYAVELLRRGATVSSFDMSDRMLELAAKRMQPFLDSGQATLQKHNLENPLPFKDAAFHVVNAPLCLDYVADWRLVFCEFFRVLKPGGTVLFSCGHPASDADLFKTKKYFSVESVKCVWSGFGKKVMMPSFRRSLEEVLNPLIEAGFRLDRLVEPQPTEAFRQADHIRFKRLTLRPCFLCIRAEKSSFEKS